MLYTKWRNVRTIDQVAWRNSNGFTVPLYREIFVRAREISYLSENIGGAWASLVIQHYGRGTIRINLEVRNPGCGGSMAASYITVASGRKAAGKRREEFSLRFRSLRVVKKKENITRDHVFLSAQLYRVRYIIPSNMRWDIHVLYPVFRCRRDQVVVISHQVLCRRCRKSIRRTNVRRRNVRQFFARIALQTWISYTWFVIVLYRRKDVQW